MASIEAIASGCSRIHSMIDRRLPVPPAQARTTTGSRLVAQLARKLAASSLSDRTRPGLASPMRVSNCISGLAVSSSSPTTRIGGSSISHHNTHTVSNTGDSPLAVLWELRWNENRLLCAVYRCTTGLQLRVESARTVIVSEPFVIEPRALARAQKLRDD